MGILICKSYSGDTYVFKCERKPSQLEFENYVRNHVPVEYDEGSCIEIEEFIPEDSIKTIIFHDNIEVCVIINGIGYKHTFEPLEAIKCGLGYEYYL